MIKRIVLLAVALASVAGASFAGSPGEGFKTLSCRSTLDGPMPGSSERVLRVGADQEYKTIQAAVDASQPGDTVLVGRGVYHESVQVNTSGLLIHGVDRNDVVLDGGSSVETVNGEKVHHKGLEVGISIAPLTDDQGVVIKPAPDNVLVENMTAHNYLNHGFYWFQVKGYWGRYLTAYDNGLYGIYAFDSRCGQFDHSYTSGNADSGFYIGECYPCDAVITDIVAERNALGYSGTNAGGGLVLRDSIWRDNGLGIVPNSLDGEKRPPQRGAEIRNNLIANNNNCTAPGVSIAGTYCGGGIVLAGGSANSVAGNTVVDHTLGGIVVTALPDRHVWIPAGNVVWGNTVSHTPAQPDSMDLAIGAATGPNNCFEDNDVQTTAPPQPVFGAWQCSGSMVTPPGGDPRVEESLAAGAAGLNGRMPADWEDYPAPGPQPDMPHNDEDDFEPHEWLPALGM